MTDKSHLLRFGYAPGNYWFVCPDCGDKQAVGDKRATRCEACAESLYSQVSSVEAVADKHRAMTTVPEEAHETLWAVNIHGPDDLIAAPDYMSAVRMANAFNAWWLNLKMTKPHNDAIDARMWAVPTDWPGDDAQGHTEELSKPHPEYQWLREASALPHLPQGVGVKKLEWVGIPACNGLNTAKTQFGTYTIGSSLVVRYGLKSISKPLASLEAAKAAAQSDYEARILSALEPSAARELALEEAAQIAEDEANKAEGRSPHRVALSIAEGIRALSSPDHADAGKVEGDDAKWPMREVVAKAIAYHAVGDPHARTIRGDQRWEWFTEEADKFISVFGYYLPSAPSQEVAGS